MNPMVPCESDSLDRGAKPIVPENEKVPGYTLDVSSPEDRHATGPEEDTVALDVPSPEEWWPC